MISKKLLSVIVAGFTIFSFSTSAFAELFSVSAGIPISHSFSNNWSTGGAVESDGVSGYMLHVKFPIMVGVGMDSYTTKIKKSPSIDASNLELSSNLYDLFYLLPIPIVNVTLGVGLGSSTLDCKTPTGTCKDRYEAGSAGSTKQFWGQLGFPVLPFLDIHASYHKVTATVKGKGSISDLTFNGTLMALGVAFIF